MFKSLFLLQSAKKSKTTLSLLNSLLSLLYSFLSLFYTFLIDDSLDHIVLPMNVGFPFLFFRGFLQIAKQFDSCIFIFLHLLKSRTRLEIAFTIPIFLLFIRIDCLFDLFPKELVFIFFLRRFFLCLKFVEIFRLIYYGFFVEDFLIFDSKIEFLTKVKQFSLFFVGTLRLIII
jgi:hypothetical protein